MGSAEDALSALPRLLNECQLSCAVHVRAAKVLTTLRRAHPDAFSQRLTPCIQSLLLVPKVSAPLCTCVARRASLPAHPQGVQLTVQPMSNPCASRGTELVAARSCGCRKHPRELN